MQVRQAYWTTRRRCSLPAAGLPRQPRPRRAAARGAACRWPVSWWSPPCRTWTGRSTTAFLPSWLTRPARGPCQGQVQRAGLSGFIMERTAESDAGHDPGAAAQGGFPGPCPDAGVRDLATVLPPATPARSATCCASPFRRGSPGWRRNSRPTNRASGLRQGPVTPATCAQKHANGGPAWADYRNGRAFLRHLKAAVAAGRAQRPPGLRPGGWPQLVAEAVAAVRPPAVAPWWWCPTTATLTGSRRHWRSSCPPATSPG